LSSVSRRLEKGAKDEATRLKKDISKVRHMKAEEIGRDDGADELQDSFGITGLEQVKSN
jgi:hypothetical protein